VEDILSDSNLDLVFRQARTFSFWQDRPVSDVLVQAVYDLARMGPTSANCCPARFVFVKSREAKERLKPHLAEGNIASVMASPVTVLMAYDLKFRDLMPELFPHAPDAVNWFGATDEQVEWNAFRNATLQGAYLMMAARAVGLDCGPMSGFDPAGVNAAFFADGDVRVNFICALGYGDSDKLYPRGPRLDFDRACQIL
jgi:3-hydroxypropanoate dehydrogenase